MLSEAPGENINESKNNCYGHLAGRLPTVVKKADKL
jgi:hypothetical protein